MPLNQREFRAGRRYRGVNKHYMDHRFYRHEKLFRDPEGFGSLFEQIPFLNGGLFECLDTGTCKADEIRVDGFSDVPANQPVVPNVLFFGQDIHVDLREAYGMKNKRDVKVDGLFRILDAYTFTIAENTPIEEEIALDPELLGRIFENLLAEYNPETERTARKETGSFYTPRPIVDYMTGESLKAYMEQELVRRVPRCTRDDARVGLDILFNYTEKEHPFDAEETRALVDAVYDVRVFDPACGSGAFPMGMLQKMVFILEKLDRDHRRWKSRILADTPPAIREETRQLLERSSAEHNWKLGLIQHSIYGADIQPIAVQIAKLRCFISLLVDFTVDARAENKGVPALPNLDFKFVAANSLIPAPGEQGERKDELGLREQFFDDFAKAAEEYFYVRDPSEKQKLREKIEALIAERIAVKESELAGRRGGEHTREDLRKALAEKHKTAIARAEREKALWESYRNIFSFRNAPVNFFDTRYFFPEIRDGFNITIGNPPYVRADEPSEWNRIQRAAIMECKAYETLWEKWDLFVPFIERAYKLLRPGGVSTMIVSDAFCHSKYAQKSQNWLLQNARILRLDFCSELKIFDAGVHNVITILQNADGTRWKPERRLHKETFGNVTRLPTDRQENLTYRAFFPEGDAATGFSANCITLDQLCYVSVGMVIHANEKLAKGSFLTSELLSDIQDTLHPKPFAEGKNLERWILPANSYLEWGTERAPKLFRRQTFLELYDHPDKIMLPMVGDIRAAYDRKRLLCNHGIFVCVPWHYLSGVRNNSLKKAARYKDEKPPRPDLPKREDLEATSHRFSVKYLLAVMNSTPGRDFLRSNRRNNVQLYPDDWKKLPIPDVPKERQRPVVEIVDKILAARKADPAADISDLEVQVDALVAGLYQMEATPPTPASTMTASLRKRPLKSGDLKVWLREECLPTLKKTCAYFDIESLRACMKAAEFSCAEATLKRYMAEMEEGGFAFDAGKGWYSFVKTPYRLDKTPVRNLVGAISEKFPLLNFACWSTRQVNRYMHHMLGKFVSFAQVDRDAMQSVYDFLKDAGFDVWLNPDKRELDKIYSISSEEKTVIVRPLVTRSPMDGFFAAIEKILVDLAMELKTTPIMNTSEFKEMAYKTVTSERVVMAELISYAKRRKLSCNDLMNHCESTISNFSRSWR